VRVGIIAAEEFAVARFVRCDHVIAPIKINIAGVVSANKIGDMYVRVCLSISHLINHSFGWSLKKLSLSFTPHIANRL
jgi:hypothetical protein